MPFRSCLLLLLLPVAAHALCTSDATPEPTAVLERFLSADCDTCWRDRQTPEPAAGTLVLDWVLPGSRDDAPLQAVASEEALQRLAALRKPVPGRASAVFSRRNGDAARLRLAQGDAFNDYVAASIALRRPGREPWDAWLLLVEQLPAGTEGSPVARNLVRNVFRPDWGARAGQRPAELEETRAMQVHEGARPERLRLVAILQDARGRIRGIRQTACPP